MSECLSERETVRGRWSLGSLPWARRRGSLEKESKYGRMDCGMVKLGRMGRTRVGVFGWMKVCMTPTISSAVQMRRSLLHPCIVPHVDLVDRHGFSNL
jgi:hypothetical protein